MLITSWLFGVANPKLKVLLNVLIIVFGVALASFGEIRFVWLGFFYQMGGIVFEAIRLIMIQILLSGDGQSMDPLVSLYYYAPVCAVMNGLVAAVTEMGEFQLVDVWNVGVFTLLANAGVAFLLNVASVFLVRCLLFYTYFRLDLEDKSERDRVVWEKGGADNVQIGKTSGLVMTLCGVLKNILLVIASVLIWGTIITGLQVLGYGIATAGLVYYGVGYEGVMTYYQVTQTYAKKLWEGEVDTSTAPRSTLVRKALFVGMYTTIVLLLIIGIGMRTDTGQDLWKDLTGADLSA